MTSMTPIHCCVQTCKPIGHRPKTLWPQAGVHFIIGQAAFRPKVEPHGRSEWHRAHIHNLGQDEPDGWGGLRMPDECRPSVLQGDDGSQSIIQVTAAAKYASARGATADKRGGSRRGRAYHSRSRRIPSCTCSIRWQSDSTP